MRKHEELRRELAAELLGMPEHTPLPTERDLATRYGVSRNTVRLALDALESQGRVYRVQGAGTFVSSQIVSKSPALTSFSEDMASRGLRPGSRLLAADVIPATARVATSLALDGGADVIRISRLRTADDRPMCLENVHLPAAVFPGLTDHDLTGSLYELLRGEYRLELHRAEQAVRAVDLDETRAALLGVVPGSSGLEVERVGLDQRDRPVEATTTTYRADRYEVRFTVRRT